MRATLRWLLAPPRRWWTVGAASVLLLAVLAAVVSVPRDDELTDRVANAVARTDPLSRGPVVTSIPPDCGLSLRTIDRLVTPAAEGSEARNGPDEQDCAWRRLGGTRELRIEVEKAHEKVPRGDRVAHAAQSFVTSIRPGSDSSQSSPTAVRPVTGLGADAVAWQTTGSDTGQRKSHVVFWDGNAAVEVEYGGESVAADVTRTGGLRAATEVARSMDLTVTGTPRIGTASDRTVESVPAACDVLPKTVVDDLAPPDAGATPEDSYLFDDEQNASGGACGWGYDLNVEIEAAKGSDLGTGEQLAARRYLNLVVQARSSEPDTDYEDAEVYTAALRGLGDEAFMHYERGSSSAGTVVFRERNVLVRVSVRGLDSDNHLSRRDALDAAYRAARAAARTVGA